MSNCGTCGRERGDEDRFCGTCGAEFTDSPDASDSPTAGSATRIDGPTGQSDPFASWYQPPGGLRESAAQQYPPTQTVLPTPAQPGYPRAGYPQPPQGPPAGPSGFQGQPPMGYQGPPSPPGGPRRGGPRALLIALAVIVVLAAGGGAYALATTLGKHGKAQPGPSPSVSAPALTQPSTSPPTSPGTGQGPSQTPAPTLSLVQVGPGVTSTVDPSVETLLSHYFHGINTRDYAEYSGTLNATQRAKQSQSQAAFDAGYATTQDTGMTLTSLSGTSGAAGGLTATVTFTSRQSPGQSVDHSACNDWTLNFYLVPQDQGYLIGPAPSGYAPDHSDC